MTLTIKKLLPHAKLSIAAAAAAAAIDFIRF